MTAFPQAINFWEKDGRKVTSSTKHRIEAYDEDNEHHRLTLSLRVHIDDASDFGAYVCVAANSLGRTEQVMYLYGKGPTVGRPPPSGWA